MMMAGMTATACGESGAELPGVLAPRRPLLEVRALRTHLFTKRGVVPAVDGISFQVMPSQCVGIVGESGSGKSMMALTLMRLLPPTARIITGDIILEGESLLAKSDDEMRHIRGNRVSMIFQEPMTSLNPVFTVGDQIAETLVLHQRLDRRAALARAVELLGRVGIPDPDQQIRHYPHQMSGGMRQRVMIAMALSCNPKLLIADEPTTALDVTIQAQILDLLRQLREETGTTVMLITHDLGIVAELADEVIVMYAGRIVERADVATLFVRPGHPYTEGLLQAMPSLIEKSGRLRTIEGTVPSPMAMPAGCPFHPRCPYARDLCREQEPPLFHTGERQAAACWRHADDRPEVVA
jgi:oligopeptide/dipeptide ABC transporter ATP-binding protein